MSTIQPHTRWVSRGLMAVVSVSVCMLLFATGTRAAAPNASPLANSSATSQLATARTAAVRTLASRTRALRTCQRIHPGHCAADRRAIKRAARRAATLGRSARFGRGSSGRGSTSRRSAARRSATGTSAAPTTTVAGATSSSTSVAANAGAASPGAANFGAGSNSSESVLPPSATGSPTPILEAPAPSTSHFEPGINSGWNQTWDVPGAAQLGAKLVRLDMNIEQTPQELESIIGAYAARGIRVMPLADFHGTLPTPAEAQNLATWAATFGPGGTYWASHTGGQFAVHSIEFGNETSYSYQYSNDTDAGYASRAQTYALRFAEAATAIRSANPGVGLLAQGDAGNAGSLWVENMFKAVPNLGQLVAGWTIHPYGPGWRPRLEELIEETAAQGAPSTIPIDITEWGLATDNGRCLTENYGWSPCMTYDEAGETLTRTVTEMQAMLGGRLGMFLLYQIRDQQLTSASNEREAYFGALQHELQPKGAFTSAVEEMLAS